MWNNGVDYSEGWNFGPNDKDIIEVEKIVKEVIKIWGEGEYEAMNNTEYHEANLLKLDISKATHKLGWMPVLNIETAIKNTVKWYREFYFNKDGIGDYTKKSITEFQKISLS